MENEEFVGLVRLACHDLRTPLATVSGVARLLVRQGDLGEGDARLARLIDDAAAEMAALVDELVMAARIAAGRYEPLCREADTLELASAADARIAVTGSGATVSTDVDAVAEALDRLALAALRFGGADGITWTVAGRTLVLAPVPAGAAAVVEGTSPRDLGALVARLVLEELGGTVSLEPGALRVELGSPGGP
jgi:signal transduction histidine kinase